MNCIDAIEGATKSVLSQICAASIESAVDMSEYIRSVQNVLEATRRFVVSNPEITPEPDVLVSVLYRHAREVWIELAKTTPDGANGTDAKIEEKEYLEYCFDYISQHGTYPL